MPLKSFKKVRQNVPLSQKVEEQLREAILQKIYNPGDRLPSELELVDIFGVSRSGIREALRILAGQGLVDIQGRNGAYVAEFDSSQAVKPFASLILQKCGNQALLHLIQARRMLEPANARMAALNRSEQDIRDLEENYASMSGAVGDTERIIQLDIKFHTMLANASGNPIVPIIMEPIFLLLPKLIATNFTLQSHRHISMAQHEQILERVVSADPEGAYRAMLEHMQTAENHVLQSYDEMGLVVENGGGAKRGVVPQA